MPTLTLPVQKKIKVFNLICTFTAKLFLDKLFLSHHLPNKPSRSSRLNKQAMWSIMLRDYKKKKAEKIKRHGRKTHASIFHVVVSLYGLGVGYMAKKRMNISHVAMSIRKHRNRHSWAQLKWELKPSLKKKINKNSCSRLQLTTRHSLARQILQLVKVCFKHPTVSRHTGSTCFRFQLWERQHSQI